jgi:hypothetical protein
MSHPQLPRRAWLAFGSCVLLCLSLAACKEDEKQSAPTPSSHVVSETFTREIQPRNPDKDNGEKQRILKRDGLGRLREIQIDFKGGHRGLIYKNPDGKTDSVKIIMSTGEVREGKPGINRAVGEGKATAADDKRVVDIKPAGQDGIRSALYSRDGLTEEFYELVEGDTRTDVRLDKDGKIMFSVVHRTTGLKLSMKLFDGGNLVYEENASRPDAVFGGVNYNEGTVYDQTGKVTHRLKLREGPFDNGVGRVEQVEELAADGSIANTFKGDTLAKATLGPALENIQVLRKEQQAVNEVTNEARRAFLVIEQDLSLLLQDTTK